MPEVYPEPFETSKGWNRWIVGEYLEQLTIFAKSSILDAWQGSEQASSYYIKIAEIAYLQIDSAGIYQLKVNRNTRKRCKIWLKLTIKTP